MADYPVEWKRGEIQARVRELAGHKCEHCGIKFIYGSNTAVNAKNSDGKPVIGTVHHINGNKADCSYENLLYCCQRCHLHIQGTWKPGDMIPASWYGVPEWIIKRGLPYRDAPGTQQTLPGF